MPRTPGRPPLSRERITAAALEVADRGGATAISMRKVAEALGVEAMALYHHVPNKAAVLDAAVDAVFAEMEVGAPGADWQAAIDRRCWSVRRVLARHSWVLGLIESGNHVGPHRWRHQDAVLGILLGAGFAPVEAVLAVSALDSYVYGFVLQEKQQGISAPADTEQAAGALVEALADDDLKNLRAVAEAVAAGAPSHDDAFGHGLRVILAGLRPAG